MHAYCVHLLPQIKVRLSRGNLMPHNCALNANNAGDNEKKEAGRRKKEREREEEGKKGG